MMMESGVCIGIVCGSGTLPFAVADAAIARGARIVLFAIRGFADPSRVARYPHHWVSMGEVGRLHKLLRKENCSTVALIGGLLRPALREVRFDFGTLRALPKILRAFRGGDDHLISTLSKIFEDKGVRIVGIQDIAPEILSPQGVLTAQKPDTDAMNDIALGRSVLHAIGPYDIGQAAIVIDGHVIAIEGAEGTDGLLARVAQMRAAHRIRGREGHGVLVKAPKPGQDLRFDLPTIGPQTIAGAKAANLAGIAVVAHLSLLAEAQETIAAAEKAGLFVFGFAHARHESDNGEPTHSAVAPPREAGA